MAFFFNACPKCRGTLREHTDDYGTYLHCISCGFIVEPPAKNEGVTAGDSQGQNAN
jgi:hypothetical protein